MGTPRRHQVTTHTTLCSATSIHSYRSILKSSTPVLPPIYNAIGHIALLQVLCRCTAKPISLLGKALQRGLKARIWGEARVCKVRRVGLLGISALIGDILL